MQNLIVLFNLGLKQGLEDRTSLWVGRRCKAVPEEADSINLNHSRARDRKKIKIISKGVAVCLQ